MICRHHSDDYYGCIEKVPIFKALNHDEMTEVATIARAVSLDKGELVYTAGDKGGKLYVLHEGRVKISRINASGKEQVIRVAEPGDFIGETSLFSSLPLTDNAEALEKTTMCIIEGQKLKELMAKYTSIAFKIMDELSNRLEKAEKLIETISLNSVEQRIAQALLSMADKDNLVTLNMRKGDFASQMGMSQETLSRKLTSLQDDGIIRLIGHKKILILNKEKLENILLG